MTPIVYTVWKTVAPEDIHIEKRDDFFPHRGYSEDDWPNLLNIAKAASGILRKQALKQPLSPIEKEAFELYYGRHRPRVEIGKDGGVDVSSGKHRMLALKEAGVCLRMPIKGVLMVREVKLEKEWQKERIRNPEDLVLTEGSMFGYIVTERLLETERLVNNSQYKAMVITDEQTERDFLLIPREDIDDFSKLVKDIENWKKAGIQIYVTNDKIRKDIEAR